MKLVNSALVIALAFPLVSFADMPADAPGKLNKSYLWNRCAVGPEIEMPIEEIIEHNKIQMKAGCFGQLEFNYANAKGVVVGCVGQIIVYACKVNSEYPKEL